MKHEAATLRKLTHSRTLAEATPEVAGHGDGPMPEKGRSSNESEVRIVEGVTKPSLRRLFHLWTLRLAKDCRRAPAGNGCVAVVRPSSLQLRAIASPTSYPHPQMTHTGLHIVYFGAAVSGVRIVEEVTKPSLR